MKRRTFCLGAAAAGVVAKGVVAGAVGAARAAESNPLTQLESMIGGRLGVAAIDTANGKFVGHWPDLRFAMCSTFKWLLVAQVLSQVDAGALTLDEELVFTDADLLSYAPVAKANVGKGRMSLAGLCAAVAEVSDNTAANLLLARFGGPQGFTAFCRGIGDTVTRLDRNEPRLNTNFDGDVRDTTSPRAMAETMRKVLVGDVLSPASRDRLIDWMANAKTGLDRLRAGLPKDWKVGDKTGSGERGAINNVAIAWPPGRPPIIIAAYLSGSRATLETLNATHAEIARTVVRLLS